MAPKNREEIHEAKEKDAKLDLAELGKAGGFMGGGNAEAATERNKELIKQAEEGYQGTISGPWGKRCLLLFLAVLGVFLVVRILSGYE